MADARMRVVRFTAAGSRNEAEIVRADLEAALKERGIVLPSLSLESFGYQGNEFLIHLGGCNQETARKLTAALRKAPEQCHDQWQANAEGKSAE